MTAPIVLVTKPTASDEVRKSVVDLLRDTLAEAESGNIVTLVMIIGHPDNQWSNRSSVTQNTSEMIGRLEITKQSILTEFLKNDRDE
jgi:hypothetical protein